MDIEEGDTLSGPFWPEPVEVIKVEPVGEGYRIFSVGENTQESYTDILSRDQICESVEITKKEEHPEFSADSRRFQQAIEVTRIDLAAEYDSNFALNTSQIDPVPHQLEAVYEYMLPENFPDNRIKFFLADDAGAGKTIMAGLLIKELRQRGIVENCLILSPAKLQAQWQSEMLRLFDEQFQIIEREHIRGSVGNPWEDAGLCITSMSFGIQDYVEDSLRDMQWDLVVVDEAHHLSAYRYGADEDEDKTERYKLGELLRQNSLHRLFLSATPHKGRRDHFQLLLRLLDDDLFAEDQLPREIVHADTPGTVFLRRMKEDMMDLQGDDLFEPRNVHTVNYQITDEELEFYEAVTNYVETQFQSAWQAEDETRNVQFALMVLQRRVASSIRAARRSLERRKEGLEALLEDVQKLQDQDFEAPDAETLEEMAERQRWEIEEEAIRRLTMSSNQEELEAEINTLESLIRKAERIETSGDERKLRELRRLLRDRHDEMEFFENEKIIIFTEAKDTLQQLTERVESWGYEYVTIEGGMDMGNAKDPREGTRLWAERQFNDPDGPQVLIATDAAGEGINLHKECRLMINYDIPWNPTRLEQRMGRIHRYGQDQPVHIYNLVASNTREGYVLTTLLEKLEVMREDIGSDRVFDVINELSEEVNLDKLIQDVISGVSSRKDAEARLDELDEQGKEAVARAEDEGLATRHIDLRQVKQMLRENKERRLSPEYIEKFFLTSFRLLDGVVEQRRDGKWRIEWVPADIRNAAQEAGLRPPNQEYRKFTLRKSEAQEDPNTEFVAPGHPLFDAVAHKVREEFSVDLNQGTAFVDPDTESSYILWFVRQAFEDGNRETVSERVFCVGYLPDEDKFSRISEAILHDLKPLSEEDRDGRVRDVASLYEYEDDAISWFYDNVANDHQSQVQEERREVVETIRPSMKQALNSAILDLREDIKELEDRKEEGEDVKRVLENKRRKRDKLKARRENQLEQLNRAEEVFPTNPEILGATVVLPPVGEEDEQESGEMGMARDDEVEQIAMEVTMGYEENQGREPEDVSEENLGFDVRSLDYADSDTDTVDEARYIEVKGRAGEGSVALTENEWTMAHRFGDEFWLYVVTNTKTKETPDLHMIQNPASKLEPREHTVVRYFVDQDDWRSKSREVQ